MGVAADRPQPPHYLFGSPLSLPFYLSGKNLYKTKLQEHLIL